MNANESKDPYEGHTPGPYSIERQTFLRHGGLALEGECTVVHMEGGLCEAIIVSLGCEENEKMATARLIADAPKLLEENRRLRAALERFLNGEVYENPPTGDYADFAELGRYTWPDRMAWIMNIARAALEEKP